MRIQEMTARNAMAIPDFQTLMLPLLKAVSDNKSHPIKDLYHQLSDEFGLTHSEREELLPSGRDTIIKNRIAWAKTYLKKAGLVSSPTKGIVQITSRGLDVIKGKPEKINNTFLRQFEEFAEFRPFNSKDRQESEDLSEPDSATPEENFDTAYQRLRYELESELLDTIKQSSPYFFEKLVLDLMIALGYGGSRKEAGRATQRSNDGGIDGVIHEDKLGLDAIYLQAKRYTDSTVGAPQLREFAGALQGMRSRKGVFITTTSFSKDAREFVEKIDSKIVLIDGKRLVELMIDHSVGVSTKEIYEIKQVDSDYFNEE